MTHTASRWNAAWGQLEGPRGESRGFDDVSLKLGVGNRLKLADEVRVEFGSHVL
jgi:hypothetical protein